MQKAFLTGITGQDGSYLAELLLEKGYEVHGMVRRTSQMSRNRIDHLQSYREGSTPRLYLHYGDLTDGANLLQLLHEIHPDEIYHLAGQSHIQISMNLTEHTCDINGMGTVRLLEGILKAGLIKKTRYYQASSSEIFGRTTEWPQTENTPFQPCSPYACAKVFAHHLTRYYRESHGLYACCGILFNHESPRRGENFVTRKITRGVARIKTGKQKELPLGNLQPKRDWGYAKEYVEAMWRMLQQDHPNDYVIATNESHSVEEFVRAAFAQADLDWRDHVTLDKRLLRPNEAHLIQGDYSNAKKTLDWEPQTRMLELVKLMVHADIHSLTTQNT